MLQPDDQQLAAASSSAEPQGLPAELPYAASNSAEPQGLPAEYGLPELSTEYERDRWERQERYLRSYVKHGNHVRTCNAVGVARQTSLYWEEHNLYGFRDRLKLAQEKHRELLEEENIFAPLQAASPRDKLLHPVLPIFALKGAWKEKYGDQVTVQDSSGVRQVLQGLRALAQRRLQAPVAEAQVTELPPGPPSEA